MRKTSPLSWISLAALTAALGAACLDPAAPALGSTMDTPETPPDTVGSDLGGPTPDALPTPDAASDPDTAPGGLHGACCSDAEPCADGHVCVDGTCATAPGPGECWAHADCDPAWGRVGAGDADGDSVWAGGPTSYCLGASLCGCAMDCFAIDAPGTCEPLTSLGSCCNVDDHCEWPLVCANLDASGGGPLPPGEAEPPGSGEAPGPWMCVPPASFDGQCYTDAQCPGAQICLGAASSTCYVDAFFYEPGTCVEPVTVPCCATDTDCSPGQVCAGTDGSEDGGVCKDAPAQAGLCWSDAQCAPGFTCDGGFLCPCGAICGAAEVPGVCTAPPAPEGCCSEDWECPNGQACTVSNVNNGPNDGIAIGACEPLPTEPGRCWKHEDCGDGLQCYGAMACPCGAECDQLDAPGVCTVLTGAKCAPVPPEAVGEVCGAANTVVFDGAACVPTCIGCCGCDGFCDLTFPSVGACEAACGLPSSCAVFDGGCDDAIPDAPWFYWDGTTCQVETSCMCDGCPGTFTTLEACVSACQ